jgi:hypothetical protein
MNMKGQKTKDETGVARLAARRVDCHPEHFAPLSVNCVKDLLWASTKDEGQKRNNAECRM